MKPAEVYRDVGRFLASAPARPGADRRRSAKPASISASDVAVLLGTAEQSSYQWAALSEPYAKNTNGIFGAQQTGFDPQADGMSGVVNDLFSNYQIEAHWQRYSEQLVTYQAGGGMRVAGSVDDSGPYRTHLVQPVDLAWMEVYIGALDFFNTFSICWRSQFPAAADYAQSGYETRYTFTGVLGTSTVGVYRWDAGVETKLGEKTLGTLVNPPVALGFYSVPANGWMGYFVDENIQRMPIVGTVVGTDWFTDATYPARGLAGVQFQGPNAVVQSFICRRI